MIELTPFCLCGHSITAHAGLRGVCAIYSCGCQAFRPADNETITDEGRGVTSEFQQGNQAEDL